MVKRKYKIFILAILAVLAIFFIFTKGYQSRSNGQVDNIIKTCPRYEIDVIFAPEDKTLQASQKLFFINNTGKELSELYFHLYPNAFKTIDSAPFPLAEMDRAYPTGFSPGYINVKEITIDFQEAFYEIDDTILKVVLAKPSKPGETLLLNMSYAAVIPPSQGRYGYGENTYNIANWYPILAVYDDMGWHVDPYYDVGDPFFSEVGLYEVRIKAPKEYTIAASGSLNNRREEGDYCYWEFNTDLVRDFAWLSSANFDILTTQVDKTKITSYYIKGDDECGKKALEFGAKAIKFFNDYFGPYPYENFAVVAADFYIGGMEYPNLVMIGHQFYNPGDFLEYIVVHETAHQWWYGLVGNNEIKEPWLDEALTEYSTILYYEDTYGKRIGQQVYEHIILNPYIMYELEYGVKPISRSLSEFSSWSEYSAVVYSRGAIMLKELERRMGKGKLREALGYYLRNNQYKNATTDNFIEALNQGTGTNWGEYIYQWLEGEESLEEATG